MSACINFWKVAVDYVLLQTKVWIYMSVCFVVEWLLFMWSWPLLKLLLYIFSFFNSDRLFMLQVQDLHSITPDYFLEVSGAVIHPLSYQQVCWILQPFVIRWRLLCSHLRFSHYTKYHKVEHCLGKWYFLSLSFWQVEELIFISLSCLFLVYYHLHSIQQNINSHVFLLLYVFLLFLPCVFSKWIFFLGLVNSLFHQS